MSEETHDLEPAPEDDPPIPERVEARWVHSQPVFVPRVGIVAYGDVITVTAEQLANDRRLQGVDEPFDPPADEEN